ncbi:MAG TPA: hypothetical protein VGX24_17035 [Pyrinomonadaceae bacterium]|nr:hypothetical protein [Pyrinomonadaceae bacterium]
MRIKLASVVFISLLSAHIACAQSPQKPEPGIPGPPAPRKSTEKVEDVSAQVDKSRVKKQAQELADAFVAGNFEKMADLTYPALVELLGGKDKMVAGLKQEMSGAGAEGFRVLSMPVGEPKRVVKSRDYLLSVVPVTMRVKMSDGVFAQRITYLGVSQDGGQNWTFVSGGVDKQMLKVLFPSIPTAIDELELPAEMPPVREGNQ